MNKQVHKRLRKKRKGFRVLISSIFIALVIFVVLFVYSLSHKGLVDYSNSFQIKGISSDVQVFRDSSGMVHIYAGNEDDLYKATGYLMAQERIWQMDLLRRVTQGRLSEIFGDDYIETDLLLRSLRFSEKSKSVIEQAEQEQLNALLNFSAGVNQYINDNKNNLPLEFILLGYKPEDWTPEHSMNLIGYMAWDLKAGWNELVYTKFKNHLDSLHYIELLPMHEKQQSVSFSSDEMSLLKNNKLLELSQLEQFGLDVLSGSNNWAVAGKKSVTGKPILANDMHLTIQIPGIWFQIHQCVPEKLNVAGLALPGQPLVIVGHNDSIAWGMTNTYVDNLDYYQEKINPKDSNQYLFNGEWKDFLVVKEDIKGEKGVIHQREYKLNHRGPVVSKQKGISDKVLTIKWVGDEPSNEFNSIFKVNRAKNWIEFKEAFRTFRSISQNIVYADFKGNIGLQVCAGIPIRKRNKGFEILPGWTDEYDWKDFVPFEELPYEFNPERGYVSSANNKTTDSTYSHHIGSWYALPYRIEKIRECLDSKEKLSVKDFMKIQNDVQSNLHIRIINKCFSKIDKDSLTEFEVKVYNKVKNSKGEMESILIEPTVIEFFIVKLQETIFKDEFGEDLWELYLSNQIVQRNSLFNYLEGSSFPYIDNVNTGRVESEEEIISTAFHSTIEYLCDTYGKDMDKWKWGLIHSFTLRHPLSKKRILNQIFKLNRGPYPIGGSYHTVSPFKYEPYALSKGEHGASHRHIYSFESSDSVFSVIPTGNSGLISSEYYCNQSDFYFNGKYFIEKFTRKSVEKNAKYKIVITPFID